MSCKNCGKKCVIPTWKTCDACSRVKRHPTHNTFDYTKIAETYIVLSRENEYEYYFSHNQTPTCRTCRMELTDYIDLDGNKHKAPEKYCDTTCEKIGNTYSRMFGLYRKSVV
jgi:hypothetical protein